MRHTIKTEILQAVLNYLALKPYSEVQNLVTAIQSDAKVDPLSKTEIETNAEKQEDQSESKE